MLRPFLITLFLAAAVAIGYAFYGHQVPFSGNVSEEAASDAIQGDWRCVYIDDVGEMACETCESEPYRQLRIKGDTVYEFGYPFQYYGKWSVAGQYSMGHDTLIIGKKYFLRDSYDDKVIRALVRDSINRDSLIGNWLLITKYKNYEGDGQGDGLIHVDFPFTVPKKLPLNRAAVYSTKNPRTLLIPVNGKKQEFYIKELSFRAVTLVTGSWRKETFELEYTRHADVTH